MNKSKILAALIAAGVTEANESMTVEALKALAAEKGVVLEKPSFTRQVSGPKGRVPGDDYYDAMRQAKVTAGLSLADAMEVTARQRKEDEVSGFTLPAAETEELAPE